MCVLLIDVLNVLLVVIIVVGVEWVYVCVEWWVMVVVVVVKNYWDVLGVEL